jgi:hypothetical protein
VAQALRPEIVSAAGKFTLFIGLQIGDPLMDPSVDADFVMLKGLHNRVDRLWMQLRGHARNKKRAMADRF